MFIIYTNIYNVHLTATNNNNNNLQPEKILLIYKTV